DPYGRGRLDAWEILRSRSAISPKARASSSRTVPLRGGARMRNVSNNCWPLLLLGMMGSARASDHLDTPSTIADPAADIGDIYAGMSPDGGGLNLIMPMVGRKSSDRLQYVFHIDSGPCFGETTATTSIVCRFDAAGAVDCRAGDADSARGDAGVTAGLEGN